MRLIYLLAGLWLLARTWAAFYSKSEFVQSALMRAGPIFEIAWITGAAMVSGSKPDSWIVLLYVMPILQAGFVADLLWSIVVGFLAAAAFLFATGVQGIEHLRYTFFSFQLFFLVVIASLVTLLGREMALRKAELAVATLKAEFSDEVHDGLQQYLVGIARNLELAAKLGPAHPERALEIARDQSHVAHQAADELRLLLHRVRSDRNDPLGLREALRIQSVLFEQRTGIEVDTVLPAEEVQVAAGTEHALLRIVQESLTNVLKHANARRVRIVLGVDEGSGVLSVQDDGKGFEPESVESGIGMDSMSRRASIFGGSITFVRPPDGGAKVVVVFPLQRTQGACR